MVDGYPSETYDPDNPYYPRHAPRKKKKLWQQSWFWPALIGGIVLILIILSATGSLKPPVSSVSSNETSKVVDLSEQEQQLVKYILAQKDLGVNDTDIRNKLVLAGFSETDITRAYDLSDPTVQYIIEQMNNNVTKIQIIEVLLKQGVDPKTIQEKFAVIEKPSVGLAAFVKKNWFWLFLAAVAIYFLVKAGKGIAEEKKAPKVYTLEECREYAEEKLEEKNVNHNPCKEYKNRPELKQYRYVYEEPIYPEFNSGRPWGHRAGNRKYWLVAVGYDRELVDFRETNKDTDTYDFLYGMPKSFESRAATEYMRLRERSEQPLEDLREKERRVHERDFGMPYRRPYSPRRRTTYRRPRISPGPIAGYEES